METSRIFEAQTSRPPALVVLCMLTIFGSTLWIINGVFRLKYSEGLGNLYDSVTSKIFTTNISDAYIYQIKAAAVVNIIDSTLTLIGAGFMLTLRKAGFWIYLVSAVLWIIASLIIAQTSGQLLPTLLNQYTITGGIMIRILFVVLYACHLKYMNKAVTL